MKKKPEHRSARGRNRICRRLVRVYKRTDWRARQRSNSQPPQYRRMDRTISRVSGKFLDRADKATVLPELRGSHLPERIRISRASRAHRVEMETDWSRRA